MKVVHNSIIIITGVAMIRSMGFDGYVYCELIQDHILTMGFNSGIMQLLPLGGDVPRIRK
jgi:hypothetical protein